MRLKLLNGAPISDQIDFSEPSLLPIEKCNNFYSLSRVTSAKTLKWRRITSEGTRLRTGWSQVYAPENNAHNDTSNLSLPIPSGDQSLLDFTETSTNFDTTSTFDAQSSIVDDYLEQSLLFHNTLVSSQVLPDDDANDTSFISSSFDTSFGTSFLSSGGLDQVDGPTVFLQVPPTIVITSLGSLPNAQQIQSMYPKTLTPNFLCVLMTAPERREVFVRKGGYKMDIWEIIVADDTRSGFKVSIWSRPSQESSKAKPNPQDVLLQTLRSVNVGDILLLRNIALTSYRQTVYGQSLKSTITRARTTITIVMKSNGVMVYRIDALPQTFTEKFKRVQRWARAHVAVESAGTRKRKSSSVHNKKHHERSSAVSNNDDYLPPDTPLE